MIDCCNVMRRKFRSQRVTEGVNYLVGQVLLNSKIEGPVKIIVDSKRRSKCEEQRLPVSNREIMIVYTSVNLSADDYIERIVKDNIGLQQYDKISIVTDDKGLQARVERLLPPNSGLEVLFIKAQNFWGDNF